MIITISDAHKAMGRKKRYCNKGIRLFCKKYHLDYADFVKNGIEEKKLLATGDSMAIALVEAARGRQ